MREQTVLPIESASRVRTVPPRPVGEREEHAKLFPTQLGRRSKEGTSAAPRSPRRISLRLGCIQPARPVELAHLSALCGRRTAHARRRPPAAAALPGRLASFSAHIPTWTSGAPPAALQDKHCRRLANLVDYVRVRFGACRLSEAVEDLYGGSR